MKFIQHNLTFILIFALSPIAISASGKRKTIVMPAPQLGGTSNVVFQMINETKFHVNACSDREATNLAQESIQDYLDRITDRPNTEDREIIKDIRNHKVEIVATIKYATRAEVSRYPEQIVYSQKDMALLIGIAAKYHDNDGC